MLMRRILTGLSMLLVFGMLLVTTPRMTAAETGAGSDLTMTKKTHASSKATSSRSAKASKKRKTGQSTAPSGNPVKKP